MKIFAFSDEASDSFSGQIAALRRNRLDGIEIRGVDGESVCRIPLEKAKEVKRRLDDAGLTVWSIGSPIGKVPIDEEPFGAHLDLMKRTLDIARALDCRNLRFFSFYIPKDRPPREFRQKVIDRMARFVLAARGSGVELCHENEKGIYGALASECLDILTSLPSVRGVFDPANFVQCGQDTAIAWRMLKPYTKYLHVKDALENGQVVPAGKGVGHVADIIRDFLAGGGNELTVEPHLTVFSGLRALENEQGYLPENQYESRDAAFDAACAALRTILPNG